MIKRIYKDFIIAFLNSRGEIPFTFLKERLKEETLLNPHSKAISVIDLFVSSSSLHAFCIRRLIIYSLNPNPVAVLNLLDKNDLLMSNLSATSSSKIFSV